MNPRPSHGDIEELLGAYALDAVDAQEARIVESHLRDCPRCRVEVGAYRETATLLVEDRFEPAADLWDRVVAGLDEVPPPIDLSQFARARDARRPSLPRWFAAVAVVAVVLGVGSSALQRQQVADVEAALDSQKLAVEALAAFNDPSARLATLRSSDGAMQVRAVLLADGTGYVLADRLPAIAGDRAYQLWGLIDGEPVSAGVLGADPEVVRFRADGTTAALAISVERAGGAATPSLPIQLTGILT